MNGDDRERRFIWEEGDLDEIASPRASSGNESEVEVLFFRALDWLRDHYAEFVF